ncbi:MAG TPA: YgaP-like transmembrane domain, partial [Steroidobacteraceae bacterium]
MTHHIGNLNPSERTISGVLGVALSAVGLLGRGSLLRVAGVTAGALLLARAVGGHCGVKAALTGKSSLRTGMKDQWQAMRHSVQRTAAQLRRDRRSEPEP